MTADGVEIVGVYDTPEGARGAALLLHMMPATKESWASFASTLRGLGLATLAIDLRGHGESLTMGDQRLDYHRFEDADHQKKKLDVEAAAAWLAERTGFGPERIVLAGASIGANLAIWYASKHPEFKKTLALSPGLDYRGLMSEYDLAGLAAGQSALLAASEDDAYSLSSVSELAKVKTWADVSVKTLKDAGHGTTMLESDPSFVREAAEWLSG